MVTEVQAAKPPDPEPGDRGARVCTLRGSGGGTWASPPLARSWWASHSLPQQSGPPWVSPPHARPAGYLPPPLPLSVQRPPGPSPAPAAVAACPLSQRSALGPSLSSPVCFALRGAPRTPARPLGRDSAPRSARLPYPLPNPSSPAQLLLCPTPRSSVWARVLLWVLEPRRAEGGLSSSGSVLSVPGPPPAARPRGRLPVPLGSPSPDSPSRPGSARRPAPRAR